MVNTRVPSPTGAGILEEEKLDEAFGPLGGTGSHDTRRHSRSAGTLRPRGQRDRHLWDRERVLRAEGVNSGKYIVRAGQQLQRHGATAGRGHALPPPGHRPRQLPPLRARRRHAGREPARPDPARHQPQPGRRLALRVREQDPEAHERLQRQRADRELRPASSSRSRARPPPLERGGRHGLRDLPRDPGERGGHSAEGRDPHRRRSAASSTTTSTSGRTSSSAAASTAAAPGAPTA